MSLKKQKQSQKIVHFVLYGFGEKKLKTKNIFLRKIIIQKLTEDS
jgi:hypothetical protein